MAETTVNLGMLSCNRGDFEDLPVGSYIYKDNIVQFHGSSYIYDPADFDIEHPEDSATQSAPYDEVPSSLNTGWKIFADGNNKFLTGEAVDELSIDTQITPISNNIPKSSSVFDCVIQNGNAFDISAYYATGGTLATYTDLAAALDSNNNGGGVPQSLQKGGMSVKFVQTSDNKYVQYRLMADAWSVDTNDWAIAEEGIYVENPEFIYVKLDVEDKILYGIKSDGEFFFGKGCPKQVKDYIEEKISSLSLDEYEDIVAFLSDYLGSDTTLKVMIDGINASLEDKLDAEGLDPDALGTVQAVENPEYVQVTTDSEDKILEATEKDGTKVFGGDVKLLGNMEVSGVSYKVIENPEYIEVKTDSEGKIISYRDSKGVLNECAGLETPSINGIPVENILDDTPTGSFIAPREYNLPKYGYVDIEKEISFTDGENSYAPTKISKVGGKYYVTSTLVDGQVTEDSVEVTLVESDIDIDTWPADKDTKHYCKVSIDCGNYLNGTFYIEVKFQGNSTLGYPKKNFRFTFYKDILFSKKVEQKIGELIAAKKYNLKAYWLDKALVREPACYRLVQAIRETRDYNQQYPWNPDYEIFTGATGIAMNFPIRIDVSGSFYGINWFGLAKDINNFMLSDKTMNGVLIQGDDPGNQNPTYWKELDTYCWDDLLGDIDHAIGEDSLPAVEDFYDYINSRNGYTFDKETASEHLDVDNWIDAYIIFELFCCTDSLAKNLILYAGADKQVFSPMFYDMDYTFTNNDPSASVMQQAEAADKSLWRNIRDFYWEEICNRYKDLRGSVIREDYIIPFMQNLIRNIPYSDYKLEMTKWDNRGTGTLAENIAWIKTRINWMDSYFLYNN